MQRRWQPRADCLQFGGSPDVNNNGIPDYVFVENFGAENFGGFMPNPAEVDADADGQIDVRSLDADGNGVTDIDDFLVAREATLSAAGIDPRLDDDGDGILNTFEEFLADFDGDGLVNFNDATPCGDLPAAPDDGDVAGGGGPAVLFPIPIPFPIPMPVPRLGGIPVGGPVAGGGALNNQGEPLPAAGNAVVADETAVTSVEQPLERSVLVADVGDVDADSDNSSPVAEPDHSVAEESAEDVDAGLIVDAGSEAGSRATPLDVQLNDVGPATRLRFRADSADLTVYSSDPVANAAARRIDLGREYAAADYTFTAGTFRRFYVQGLRNGRDVLTVEIDPAGDGRWLVVDGLVITVRGGAERSPTARWNELPTPASVPGKPDLQVGAAFVLPAQGIGSLPGRVTLKIGPVALDCPIEKWTDSLVQARATVVMLDGPASGELMITTADGRLATTISVNVVPSPVAAPADPS